MLIHMSPPKHKSSKGAEATVPVDDASEEAMDQLLADRQGEIEAKLRQAYEDKARGDYAPLEPLHILLREARGHAATRR